MISVAIDGPSGAGKSTIARTVAQKFQFMYIDTGALYRAIGLYALESGRDPSDSEQVVACLTGISLSFAHVEGMQRVFLNGRDVSDEIRSPNVSNAASQVSAVPEVRAFLLDQQRGIAGEHNVIMDGRDIGTVVLPDAQIKIFLTASPEDRARRRWEELLARGEKVTFEEVLGDVVKRDHKDSSRAISPLRQAEDAILVDTTGNDFEKSVAIIEKLIADRLPALQKEG